MYTENQAVIWMATDGGGGGSTKRPNRKRPVYAVFKRYSHDGRYALIQVADPDRYSRLSWVRTENLTTV